MKKMKKLFAILMTMAMVMGLGITGFAAGTTATITINNAGSGRFAVVQVIKEDPTKDTGWDFVEGYAQYFTAEEAFDTEDTQAIIKGMIYAQNSAATEGQEIENFDTKYATALNNVYSTLEDEDAINGSSIEVNKAGVWVIRGFEENYSYSPMAAYVGFNYESGKPSGLLDAEEINAKKAPTYVEKSNDDADKVVEINKPVTYTITSTVPFVPETDVNRKYIVKDTITGARYDVDENNKFLVNVAIEGEDYNTPVEVTPTELTSASDGRKTQSFTLDLSTILTNNAYANKTIILTYTAIVTDLEIGNNVTVGNGKNDSEFGTDSDPLTSGKVTLTKKNTEGETLKDAVFNLVKKTGDDTLYAVVDTNTNILIRWSDNVDDATPLTTGDNGTLVVKGLEPNDNTFSYEFDEIQAPDGYSINDTNAEVEWGENPTDSDSDKLIDATAEMTDTKLASLPGTGGMGTTLFTIAGCVIMISAAGLFFATRKKAN